MVPTGHRSALIALVCLHFRQEWCAEMSVKCGGGPADETETPHRRLCWCRRGDRAHSKHGASAIKNPGPTCLLHTVLVSTRVCTFTTLRVHGLLSGACVCVSPPLLQQGNSETLRASRPRHNPKRPWPIPKEKDGVFA